MQRAHSILVVDDDEDIRDVLAMALVVRGYTVDTAANGAEALNLLVKGLRPSLVLLDMMMPNMDGEAFLGALRSNPNIADILVVLISGHSEARAKAEELHASGCLVKPIELDELVRTVERIVARVRR